MADAGYDVADYRDIDPVFGTLADAEALIARGARGRPAGHPRHRPQPHLVRALRGSRQRSPATSAARARYLFRPGRGPLGDRAAERLAAAASAGRPGRASNDADGRRATGTSTCSRPSSPTSTGRTPRCAHEFEDILRFWFDRGVDGFRIDVAHGLVKHPDLPDAGDVEQAVDAAATRHPAWDQDGVHEVYRAWRKIADCYDRAESLRRRGVGRRQRAAGALPATATSCTPRSSSTSCDAVPRRRDAQRRSMTPWQRPRRWPPRRPGS